MHAVLPLLDGQDASKGDIGDIIRSVRSNPENPLSNPPYLTLLYSFTPFSGIICICAGVWITRGHSCRDNGSHRGLRFIPGQARVLLHER